MTNPSRSWLKGRHAFSGVSLKWVESAFSFMNPPTVNSMMTASLPPATTTSARPARMRSIAKPSASVEDAQAVVTTWHGPFAPSAMAMFPAPSLAISSGMARGERRSGPLSKSVLNDCSVTSSPPMPTPRMVATRSMSGFFSSVNPASFQASFAVATAYCEKSAMWRASRLSRSPPPIAHSSKPLTSAATWQVQREASNFVILPTPGFPALMFSQEASRPLPTAVTIPIPVIITFFIVLLLF